MIRRFILICLFILTIIIAAGCSMKTTQTNHNPTISSAPGKTTAPALTPALTPTLTPTMTPSLTPADTISNTTVSPAPGTGNNDTWEALHINHGDNTIYSNNNVQYKVERLDYRKAKVQYSLDNGDTWTSCPIIDCPSIIDCCMGFSSQQSGWLIIDGDVGLGSQFHYIYLTEDGGRTWSEIGNTNELGSHMLSGAGFSEQKIGLLNYIYQDGPAGSAKIHQTLDGGVTWQLLQLQLPEEYTGYTAQALSPIFDGSKGVMTVEVVKANARETIDCYSDDYGRTWHFDASDMMKDFCALYMKDSLNGWALLAGGSFISTTDGWKTYQSVYTFSSYDNTASKPSISYADNTLFVIGYLSKEPYINIYNSKNNGQTWGRSYISDPDTKGYDGQIFSSFIDDQNGYLLYCGGPACGLMPKILYKTTDGGKTFEKVGDISYIAGYPTGVTFNSDGEGFITCSYHGNDNSYLYCSSDEGKTWSTKTVSLPEDISYKYINGYPPYFSGKDGYMILEYVEDVNIPSYVMYYSADAGLSWSYFKDLNIHSTSVDEINICDENTVYTIDDIGRMFIR